LQNVRIDIYGVDTTVRADSSRETDGKESIACAYVRDCGASNDPKGFKDRRDVTKKCGNDPSLAIAIREPRSRVCAAFSAPL
jgi:hypothetical protein